MKKRKWFLLFKLSIIIILVIFGIYFLKFKSNNYKSYNEYWNLNLQNPIKNVELSNNIGGFCADGYKLEKLIYSKDDLNSIKKRNDLQDNTMEMQGFIYEFITSSLDGLKTTKKDEILNIFGSLGNNTKYILKKKDKHSILVIIPQNQTSIYIIEKS